MGRISVFEKWLDRQFSSRHSWAIIIGIVLDYLFGEQLWGGYLAFCVYGFVYLKAVIRFNNWRCPRCKDRFYSPSFWASSPADITNCRNCNLLKYSGSSFIN